MSNRFLNDHSVRKVILSKILRITAGGFHCWADSNVGVIRKPNNAIPEYLWDSFFGRKPNISDIVKADKIDANTLAVENLSKKLDNEAMKVLKPNWWQRILAFFRTLFRL